MARLDKDARNGDYELMLRLFNTLGKRIEPFDVPRDDDVTVFTCGPSVYQRAHLGNFRTFLFEDVLVRYLRYSGYRVTRGMNLTDIEDKAVHESKQRNIPVEALTEEQIRVFLDEAEQLGMLRPEYLPRASRSVDAAVEIILRLLELGIAYRHGGNIYFDPLKYPGFGELYGLDMGTWPAVRRRFHKDTYPGMRWNRGDFILWHGCRDGAEECYDTALGRGRPSWNVQDPGMIIGYFTKTLSIYCGGVDNLVRHHDYSRAILESVRPYPMARFWLHCEHLRAQGRKISKSTGNVLFSETLRGLGLTMDEIRFYLVYGHYRTPMNYSPRRVLRTTETLRRFKARVGELARTARTATGTDERAEAALTALFVRGMDDDLRVDAAFDRVDGYLAGVDTGAVEGSVAAGLMRAVSRMDTVLNVLGEV